MTNLMNVWASSGSPVVSPSGTTAGFVSGAPIYANVFNGILKDVSLVTVGLINALISNSTYTEAGNIDNTSDDISTIISNLLQNQNILSVNTLTANTITTVVTNSYVSTPEIRFNDHQTATISASSSTDNITISSTSSNAQIDVVADHVNITSNNGTTNVSGYGGVNIRSYTKTLAVSDSGVKYNNKPLLMKSVIYTNTNHSEYLTEYELTEGLYSITIFTTDSEFGYRHASGVFDLVYPFYIKLAISNTKDAALSFIEGDTVGTYKLITFTPDIWIYKIVKLD